MQTSKEEDVEPSYYQNFEDAYDQSSWFLDDVYMHKRIHSSSGYLTRLSLKANDLLNDMLQNCVCKNVIFSVQKNGRCASRADIPAELDKGPFSDSGWILHFRTDHRHLFLSMWLVRVSRPGQS